MTEIISTKTAPAAIGPYNQAVKAGNVVFCSGQIGLVPETGEGLEAQVRQAFTNLTEVVSAAGGTFSDVVKFTLFVTDMAQFGLVNAVMKEYVKDPYPARSCVEVSSLPKGALFEVEAIAVIKEMSF